MGSALALASAVPGCGRDEGKPIAIAAHVWVGYEPLFLACREGWLDARQVRLIETASATESLQALSEGRVDGAALTLDETLKARETGLPLSVVMVFNISAGADMLVARPGIKQLASLKGQRIGFEPSSVGELLLAEVLRAGSLTPQDVQRVPLGVDKHREAWQLQQIDAAITYEPVATQLLALGAVKLFDSRQIPNTIVDVLALRREVLDSAHEGAVRHVIAAHFRALDHLRRNPQDAAYRMAGHLNLPAAEVLKAFKGLLIPDASNNMRLLAGTTPALLASARKLSGIMVKGHFLAQEDTLAALVRADYLPSDSEQK